MYKHFSKATDYNLELSLQIQDLRKHPFRTVALGSCVMYTVFAVRHSIAKLAENKSIDLKPRLHCITGAGTGVWAKTREHTSAAVCTPQGTKIMEH
jgi:hypothetical protein